MSKYGIQFNSASIEKLDPAIPQTILVRINDFRMQGYEVIIYILNQVDDDIYHTIAVTQCTRFDHLMSNNDL